MADLSSSPHAFGHAIGRRLMHVRAVDCQGFLREDGLWEVEARVRDTKPFVHQDYARGWRGPDDTVHDISLRVAVDAALVIREAAAELSSVPFLSCADVGSGVSGLVGEKIGPGWRDMLKRKLGRRETCTHLAELLGPIVTTLYQMLAHGRSPDNRNSIEEHRKGGERPFYLNGCHSWRVDGPNVAEIFPHFAKPHAR